MNEQARPSDQPGAAEQQRNFSGSRNTFAELIRQLADDVSTLLGKEIALARAEFREAADQTRSGVGGMATGFGLVLLGELFILLAVVCGLALVVPVWLASAIVGVVVLIVGKIIVRANKKKIQPESFVPERTVDSVRKDKAMTKRFLS
jgi:hypothetical protein